MHENTLTYWINVTAKRANETGITLGPSAIKKAAQRMQRIAACERIPDVDVIIRLYADPTYATAVANISRDTAYQQRLQNRANAARRINRAATAA